MKELSTEEIRKIQLDILSCIDTFCKKNSIKYSLGYGTLLGAVRHKGYIPWDDDIDLWMIRKEYDRFIKEFAEEGGRYKLGAFVTSNEWHAPFAKVFDKRTIVIHEGANTPDIGVFVDVFPIDNITSNELLVKKKRFRKVMRTFLNVKVSTMSNSYLKNIFLIVIKFLLLPVSSRFLGKKIEESYFGFENGDYIQDCAMDLIKRPIEKRVFEEYTQYEFEGKSYMGVKDADIVLKSIYNNYWELPPFNERKPKHCLKAYIKE